MEDARKQSASGTVAAAYTPASVQEANGIAALLKRHYPQRGSEECRAALARMYGHADWAALSRAVEAGTHSRCDEDEADETVAARARQQRDVAVALLGGMNEAAAVQAARLDRELLASTGASIGARYDPTHLRKRIDRARYAYAPLYAAHAVLEVKPTARDRLLLRPDDDGVRLAQRVDLLPRALSAWLKHHRPLLIGRNRDIGDRIVRRHSVTALMTFAFRWGELSMLHGAYLPHPLQIYPVALCAQWAARLTEERGGTRAGAAFGFSEPAEREQAFILAQPREDYRLLSASAREQQMNAGYALLKRHLEEAAGRPSAADLCLRMSARGGDSVAHAA